MPDLLRWLLANPIVLLIVVGWLASAIGGAVQRAARRAAAERQAGEADPMAGGAQKPLGRRGRDPEEIAREIRRAMGLEPPAAPSRSPAPPPVSRPTVARTADPAPVVRPVPPPQGMRRVSTRTEASPALPASRRVERIEEVGARWNEFDEESRRVARSFDEAPRRGSVNYDETRPRRSLSEEMTARGTAPRGVGSLRSRDAHLGDRISERHLELHIAPGSEAAAPHRAGRRALFDLSRPAAAIIAMEVLGPPVALRDGMLPHEV